MADRGGLSDAESIRRWLVRQLATRLELDPDYIASDERFSRYGLKSAMATAMVADLAKELGRDLNPTLVWDYPTIDDLSDHLTEGDAPAANAAPARTESEAPRVVSSGAASHLDEPIAIVGLSCRFPGANSADEYWENLMAGRDMIREVPSERWRIGDYFSDEPADPGKMTTRWGGFLDRVDGFDPEFFAISPREAAVMDPQQRIMLELAWEALEDSGTIPGRLKDSKTGVYFGVIWGDYATLQHRGSTNYVVQHSATGSHYSIVANRISYVLGLQGPSMALDTACSSSLVAIHLACQSLRAGESNLALAGGINLVLAPDSTVCMSKFGAMAPDGRSKAFDSRANGYVRGEGAGVIVLKRLSDALAAGDPIYCVVRGSAVNNDGFSNGLTAPSPDAQRKVLAEAYANAGVSPTDAHYVETHGTGTMLGDPIEANALGAVLCKGRSADKPLTIGSVKTNIGHTEAAAGIAGLIKLALSIKHRKIPATLHYEKPNPNIPFDKMNMRVQAANGPWPGNGEPALAGVSSFGFGGTNCHIVLEEYSGESAQLVPVSAGDSEQLRSTVMEFKNLVASGEYSLESLGVTAGFRLSSAKERVAFNAAKAANLTAAMDDFIQGRERPGIIRGTADEPSPRIAFYCPGQGAQWVGMGRSLMYREPVFRAKLEQCDKAIQDITGWSIIKELLKNEEESRLAELDVVQPAIFAMQVGYAALWRYWGVEPDAVVGHSMGEVAAAHIAGHLKLEDAARVICHRSRLAATTAGRGGMAVLSLSREKAEDAIRDISHIVSIASCNSVESTVIAGDPAALRETVERVSEMTNADGDPIYAAMINVDFASHSPQMDPLKAPLFESLAGLEPIRGAVPMFSTVFAGEVDGRSLDPAYWVRNLRETVQFAQTLARLLEEGYNTFVGLSPHPVLAKAVDEAVKFAGKEARILPSSRRKEDEREIMIDSASAIYAAGRPLLWHNMYPAGVDSVELPEHLEEPAAAARVPSPAHTEVLSLSAHNAEALREQAATYGEYVESTRDFSLHDICYTSALKRTDHEFRLCAVGSTREEIIKQLQAFTRGEARSGLSSGRKTPGKLKVAFVFSGQGPRWWPLSTELLKQDQVLHRTLERCDALLRRYVDWSLMDQLTGKGDLMERTEVIQPALCALQIALAESWRSLGISPAAVIGHSMGEIAAGYMAGAISLDDAIRIIYHRGRLIQTSAGGRMAFVDLSREDAIKAIAGREDKVSIGAANSSRNVILSGQSDAVSEIIAELENKNIFCRILESVDFASHGPGMEPLREDLERALVGIKAGPTSIPMYSTVTAALMDGWELGPEYWSRNLREPVLFADTMSAALQDGCNIFIELGPHPVLSASMVDCASDAGRKAEVLPSLRRDEEGRSVFLGSLGALYSLGYDVDWSRLHTDGGRLARLPLYPWQRQSIWFESGEELPPPGVVSARPRASGGHPLLGARIRSSMHPGTTLWNNDFYLSDQAYLRDHRVRKMPVLPGAAYVDLALAAARDAGSTGALRLENVELTSMLVLDENDAVSTQFAVQPASSGEGKEFLFSSMRADSEEWNRHASGRISAASGDAPAALDFAGLRARCDELLDEKEHYAAMDARGLDYGPAFQGLSEIRRGKGEVLARIEPAREVSDRLGDYVLHPALLDLCFQISMDVLEGDEIASTYLPVGLERLDLFRSPEKGDALYCHFTRDRVDTENGRLLKGKVTILTSSGETLAELDGFKLRRIGEGAGRPAPELLFGVDWVEQSPVAAAAGEGTWLVLGSESARAPEAARLLREKGASVVLVNPGDFAAADAESFSADFRKGDDLDRLFREAFADAGRECAGILFMGAAEPPGNPETADEILETQRAGIESALVLMQAVERAGFSQAPRLWFVTRATQPAGDGGQPLHPAHGSLWGLARVAFYELSELDPSLIDLGSGDDANELNALIAEVLAAGSEYEIALRGNKRYAARCTDMNAASGALKPVTFEKDGTYILTGGYGGLGLTFARWMAENGAGRLILTGRSGPGEGAREKIAEIEELGARVEVKLMDAGAAEQTSSAFAEIEKEGSAVKGVLHAAGILNDATILTMDSEKLYSVLDSKIKGAWNLMREMEKRKGGFLVFFSSAASYLGTVGQGNYAAGNAFMDSLAFEARRRGVGALSVNWGPWKDVGLAAAESNRGDRLASRGLAGIEPADGIQALEQLLSRDAVRGAVMAFDPIAWREAYPPAAKSAIFEQLLPVQESPTKETSVSPEAPPPEPAPEQTSTASEGSAPAADRDEVFNIARNLVGKVLGTAPNRIDPTKQLGVLGLDSLMAVEVRNLLQVELGVKLSATVALTYPTIDLLTDHLMEKAAKAAKASPATAQEPAKAEPSDVPAGIPRPPDPAPAPASNREAIFTITRNIVGKVLQTAPARIDPTKQLGVLGLDSLMAVEVRNILERELGIKLSATVALTYPTLDLLTDHLMEKGAQPSGGGTPAAGAKPAAAKPVAAKPAPAAAKTAPAEAAKVSGGAAGSVSRVEAESSTDSAAKASALMERLSNWDS